MTVTVVCADGQTRHEPFLTMREADQWAQWGHCCTAEHQFIRSAGADTMTDHSIHEIGRTECTEQGCEPPMPERPMVDTTTKRFADLEVGDRIHWRGADDDQATVVYVSEPQQALGVEVHSREVHIRWTTKGQPHQSVLSWSSPYASVNVVYDAQQQRQQPDAYPYDR